MTGVPPIMNAPLRLEVIEASVLGFPRHVTFRHDDVRERWVILAPERLLLPDEMAVEILQRMDGKRSVAQVIDVLASDFAAPRDEIAADVVAMFQDLADKGVITPQG